MPRTDAVKTADDGGAGQIEIAHGVQDLVADEFVLEAQAALVEDLVAADHDRVVQGPALGQSLGP